MNHENVHGRTLMLGYLLNLIYIGLLLAVSPVLVYRRMTQGKYRDGWGQKLFGRVPCRDTGRPCVWFHAVSVGEVLLLPQLIVDFKRRHPRHDIIVSTTTSTGHQVAVEKLPEATVIDCPLDFTWAVGNALRRIQPSILVLVELELWPNLIRMTSDSGVPVVLVNGRISERSFRGYRLIKPLMRRLLARFSHLAVQSEVYAERLMALGADHQRVHVTGSIKFDGLETERDNPQTNALREFISLRNDESVFVAGSTQAPEEQYALETYEQLRHEFPNLRLIIVPRHQERFDDVARLITAHGFAVTRRSNASNLRPPSSSLDVPPVLLLDTLGELSACWGLADVAFVGGSLHNNRGGQNMIEPSAYGAAVLFGPDTRNFRDVTDTLLARDAARMVTSREELTAVVRTLLANPDLAAKQGRRAQQFVLSADGATTKTAAMLAEVLGVDHPRSVNSAA